MCQETKDELNVGKQIAKDLLDHMHRMGAGAIEQILIEDETGKYKVSIQPERE